MQCYLQEVRRLTDDVRTAEVDGVPDGVQDAVPALHDRLRAHVRRDEVRVFLAWVLYIADNVSYH